MSGTAKPLYALLFSSMLTPLFRVHQLGLAPRVRLIGGVVAATRGGARNVPSSRIDRNMTEIPVISAQAVLAAIDPKTAIERTREAFERYGRGEWTMPAKVYLHSPPHGDFRAMPALGGGVALL